MDDESIFRVGANEHFAEARSKYEEDDDFRRINRQQRKAQLMERRSVVTNTDLYGSPRRRDHTPRRNQQRQDHRSRTQARSHHRNSPRADWKLNRKHRDDFPDMDSRNGDWDDLDEDDFQNRDEEIEEFNKLAELEFKEQRNTASTLMQGIAVAGDGLTSALGIDAIHFNGLAKKIRKEVKKGAFDNSIRKFGKTAVGRYIHGIGVGGLVKFAYLIGENHLEQQRKLLKGSKRAHKTKRRHRRSKRYARSPSPSSTESDKSSSSSSSSEQSDGVYQRNRRRSRRDKEKKKSSRRSRTLKRSEVTDSPRSTHSNDSQGSNQSRVSHETNKSRQSSQIRKTSDADDSFDSDTETVDKQTGIKRPLLGAGEPEQKAFHNPLENMMKNVSNMADNALELQQNMEEKQALQQQKDALKIPNFHSVLQKNTTK